MAEKQASTNAARVERTLLSAPFDFAFDLALDFALAAKRRKNAAQSLP